MNDLVTRDGSPEINPFSISVPDSIRALDPELHEYLRRLNRTIVQQHNRSQAGDTTFDWQVLLGLDSLPRYTPGSLGSFSHPVYGLIRARYVRFRLSDRNPNARIVGFARGTAGLEWEVANTGDKVQDQRPCGLIAGETIPLVGEYGWIITEGTNLYPQYYESKPTPGGILKWGAGSLGQFLGTSTKEGDYWVVPVGTIRIRLEAGSGGGAGGFGPGSIEDVAFEYGKQIVELENRLDLITEQSKLFISILSRRVSELTEDRASLEIYEQLQAGANWANLAGVSAFNAQKYARDGQINALATQSYLRDSKVYRDEAGFFASSATEFRNAASVNAAEASVSAGQAASASLTAQGYTAQALQYVTLAASVGDNLLKNGTFSDPRWEENQGVPPEWLPWGNEYTYPVLQRASPGKYGPYHLRMDNSGDQTECGIRQGVTIKPGKFLLGADILYEGGTFDNSGLLIQFFRANGEFLGQDGVRFTTGTPIDTAPGFQYYVPKEAAYSQEVTAPAGTEQAVVYLMNNWAGWGRVKDRTAARYYRVYLRKPMFSDAANATAYTDAQIAIVNQALATEREARATLGQSVDTRFQSIGGRVDGVVTSIGQVDQRVTSVSNNLGTEIQARQSLLAAYNQYVTDNDGRVTGIANSLAGYDQRITANANNNSATSQAVTNLTTRVGNNESNITTLIGSYDGIKNQWGFELNTNGRVTGLKAIGTAARTDFIITTDSFKMETPGGAVTPFEVSGTQFRLGVDLYAGTHRVIFDNGTVMLVLGTGFGQNNQFIEWFGPTMPIAQCGTATAITYKTVNGSAYFGGALNAGIITNAIRSSGVNDTQIVLGPFTSAGKAVNGIGTNQVAAIIETQQSNQWRTDIDPPRPDPFTNSHTQVTGTYQMEYNAGGGWIAAGGATQETVTTTSSIFTYQRFENGEPVRYSYWRRGYVLNVSRTSTINFGNNSNCQFRFTRTALSTQIINSNIIGIVSVEQ